MVTSSERSRVTSDEFPFVAKIIYDGNRVGCTGSLIAPNKVLTAGHCVSGYSNISVGFGNTRTLEPSYPVVSAILHREYSSQENDIAILQLEAAAAIQPVRTCSGLRDPPGSIHANLLPSKQSAIC